MSFPGTEELTTLIEPIAAAYGMDVERVHTTKAGKKSQVVVALDSDSHPTLDELEVVSGELSELFDSLEASGEVNFGAGYTLEVTTPGVDLPLTQPRHWHRNRSRLVKVGEDIFRIGAYDESTHRVILIETGATSPDLHVRAVSEIPTSVVEIEFNKPSPAEVERAELSFDEACKLKAK